MKDNYLQRFYQERNSSPNTISTYNRSIRKYTTLTGYSVTELIRIAETEEHDNIHWRNSQTRQWLLEYRNKLYQQYNISTAQLYLRAVITLYRHYEITIPSLPYYSTKQAKHSPPLTYQDLPTRELLQQALELTTPLGQAIITLMSSTGLSRIDILHLTINDYLQATQPYHQKTNIKQAIHLMDQKDQIIPVLPQQRQKTGQEYHTFISPEAVKYVNKYLLTRKDKLNKNKQLIKVTSRYYNTIFEKINNTLHLGKKGPYNRFHPHMLRKYHATRLIESGMSTDKVDYLQGRKPSGIAHEHYIRFNVMDLKNEYIKALPFLQINDLNTYKTENQRLLEENKRLSRQQEQIDNLRAELHDMKKRQDIWDNL